MISVVGLGYVGTANAIALSQYFQVLCVDIDDNKVEKINARKSPISEKFLQNFLKSKNLNIKAKKNTKGVYKNSKIIVLAAPTNYDPEKNFFDTSILEKIIQDIKNENDEAIIVVRSTIPVGFIDEMNNRFSCKNIIFCPEFLREGNSLQDTLAPSRFITGGDKEAGKKVFNIFKETFTNNPEYIHMPSTEAESVKLFANTYLAMRVAFFNELDSFSFERGLNTKKIIEGVCKDERIGDGYNNPSFGYGGYCLPKDTKQLLANYKNIPSKIIEGVINSNANRKDFLSEKLLKENFKTYGIYRLVMKEGSDNFRESAIFGIMKRLNAKGKKIVIYEPLMNEDEIFGSKVYKDFESFANDSDVIIANRFNEEIYAFKEKVFTRDIFNNN